MFLWLSNGKNDLQEINVYFQAAHYHIQNYPPMKFNNVMITGTGSFIPENVVTNQDFAKNNFFDNKGKAFGGI